VFHITLPTMMMHGHTQIKDVRVIMAIHWDIFARKLSLSDLILL
jgi:hypothetical protein